MDENSMAEAKNHLKTDKIFSVLIERTGELTFTQSNNIYLDILDAIVSQQLSVKAAATIFKRFQALFPTPVPLPEDILAKADDELKSVGLSFQKTKYIKSLAAAVVDQSLKLQQLENLADEEVIIELTKIKGIGRWTAEMILIFSLNRQDVFSIGDLGLRNAIAKEYNINRDDLSAIEKISKQWAPYRSIAARYLWKSLDNQPKN